MQVLHDIQQKAAAFSQQTSTTTADIKTFTPPAGARACLVTVETTAARISFHGTDPSATVGHLLQTAQNPVYLPLAVAFRAASSAAAASVVSVTWLY